jgi:calcineurin-like phosphoesterase family protein
MSIWISGDYHLGHRNILKYCNRPFKTVEEMDNAIIGNHNDLVKPNDDFYFLGDLCFKHTAKYLPLLNGRMHFIRGNHDHETELYYKTNRDAFVWMKDVYDLRVGSQRIWLSHYPHKVWPNNHHGAWHLFGHCHGSLADDPNSLSFDAGVDCHNYAPISIDEIATIMAKKTFKPIDHHTNDDKRQREERKVQENTITV